MCTRPENVVYANTEHGPFNNYYIVNVPFYLFFVHTYNIYMYICSLQVVVSKYLLRRRRFLNYIYYYSSGFFHSFHTPSIKHFASSLVSLSLSFYIYMHLFFSSPFSAVAGTTTMADD